MATKRSVRCKDPMGTIQLFQFPSQKVEFFVHYGVVTATIIPMPPA